MSKKVSEKMGLKPGLRSYLYNAPDEAVSAIELPDIVQAKTLHGSFDYIHLFVKTSEELDKQFPRLKSHLAPAGLLFVSWPKSKQLGSKLTLPEVIRVGYSHGLVESTALSINPVWSALKFTWPKPGKIYQNSYGKLPSAMSAHKREGN